MSIGCGMHSLSRHPPPGNDGGAGGGSFSVLAAEWAQGFSLDAPSGFVGPVIPVGKGTGCKSALVDGNRSAAHK